MRARTTLAVLVLAAVGFAAITLAALEGSEVVLLRTRQPDGTARETRVWVADQDGALWVEAATPERAFYRDLLATPEVEVQRGERVLRTIATPEEGPAGHERIRTLLTAKYGWADHWVGLLQDTSRSVAVRLQPVTNEGMPPR